MNCSTPAFSTDNRYFDIFVEYAKADVEDILIKITAVNRGPDAATLHLLAVAMVSQYLVLGQAIRGGPIARKAANVEKCHCVELEHWQYGKRWLLCEGQPQFLFTENETNFARLFNTQSPTPYVKDAFHEFLIHQNHAAVNPDQSGTKMAAYYPVALGCGSKASRSN